MRRLMRRARGSAPEKGATAALVVILSTVLIGAGALVIDIGRLAAEKAQLQNGADASALAIAQYCAKNTSSCHSSGPSLASTYTPANSNSSTAVPRSVSFPSSSSVRVETSTPPGGLALTFAQIFNLESQDVQADATAIWGYPTSGGGFPLALSNSCFDLDEAEATGALQRFSYKPGNGPNGSISNMECTSNASGQTIPGGWGWLSESSPCYAETSTGTAQGDPGNNPADCSTVLQGWISTLVNGQDVEVQFPVFNAAAGTGNGATYQILGYATFSIFAWQFSGGGNSPYTYMPGSIPANVNCAGSTRCIVGKFIRFEESDPTAGTGGNNYGTSVIKLIS